MNVGAFVCSCGGSCDIDLEAVRDGVRDVDVVASSEVLCQDGRDSMAHVIEEYDLDQFIATTPDGDGIHVSDGTPEGTRRISDVGALFHGFSAGLLDGRLYFPGLRNDVGVELFAAPAGPHRAGACDASERRPRQGVRARCGAGPARDPGHAISRH